MQKNMEQFTWSLLIYSTIIMLSFLLLHRLSRRISTAARLPPGPPGWPVFGNMFDLGSTPHRTLAELKKRYGPVVWLRLGCKNTVAVLTAAAAEELFKACDQSFVDRTVHAVMSSHDYHKGSVALAQYGGYWRATRRVCAAEMLIGARINETVAIRKRCVGDLLAWIHKEARGPPEARALHVAKFLFLASFNMMGNMVFSCDLADPQSREGSEFFSGMKTFMQLTGRPNIADLFPWLGQVDPTGLRRKVDRELGKILSIASKFVRERVEEKEKGTERRHEDFLDVLLGFKGSGKDEPEKLSEGQISILILEMFLAGTDTTSNTIEWAMAELLRHPEAMANLKAELARVIGTSRRMEESDIDRLPYLQAVAKETLRLHPPLPLLIPRKAVRDTQFMGYHIPSSTQVFVNVWAIGRDPDCWTDPLRFKPERFFGLDVDYKGQHFELIPFGAGRRMCAGLGLGHRVLHLLLGSLIHEFDWELGVGVSRDTMDMRERIGVAVGKLEPLLVIPRAKIL